MNTSPIHNRGNFAPTVLCQIRSYDESNNDVLSTNFSQNLPLFNHWIQDCSVASWASGNSILLEGEGPNVFEALRRITWGLERENTPYTIQPAVYSLV